MNPYEPPQTADERIEKPLGGHKPVVLALALSVGLIVGGISILLKVRVERARAIQAETIRARQAAEVELLRALEATRAKRPANPSTP